MGKEIKRARKEAGLSQKELAEKMGVSEKTIRNWESGSTITKSKEQMVKKFISGNFSDKDVEVSVPTPFYMLTETRPRIPFKALSGGIREYYAGKYRDKCEDKPLVQQFPPYHFTMLVSTDSMSPYINNCDVIACAEIHKIVEYGQVYVLDTEDGVIIRRVYDDGEQYKLESDNPRYSPFVLNKEDVKGMYKIVGLLRVEI